MSTAVPRRTRMTAVAVTVAAAATGLVWAASTGTSGASTAADTSLVLLADSNPMAVADDDPHPLSGRLPSELRADLRELRTLEPEQRRAAAARIWQDALAGDYGARVRIRALEARHRYEGLPEELRDDIEDLRGLDDEERDDALHHIRDKALDGAYGDRIARWAQRRAEVWKED
ncbi:hypothetical protein [Streptomyces sp. GESEQ-35]|uniref:hypothetical protein n=1 Tax=Streptomyces sp. GESEQ-35 TaxID=2812657 RepID=UPI001B327C0A|nr:hypothetical protein [Streptomyces sp. GESEQ-35]